MPKLGKKERGKKWLSRTTQNGVCKACIFRPFYYQNCINRSITFCYLFIFFPPVRSNRRTKLYIRQTTNARRCTCTALLILQFHCILQLHLSLLHACLVLISFYARKRSVHLRSIGLRWSRDLWAFGWHNRRMPLRPFSRLHWPLLWRTYGCNIFLVGFINCGGSVGDIYCNGKLNDAWGLMFKIRITILLRHFVTLAVTLRWMFASWGNWMI